MNVHGARVNVFEVRPLQREDTGIRAVHLSMQSNEVGRVIRRFKELPVAGANIHLVVGGGPIK